MSTETYRDAKQETTTLVVTDMAQEAIARAIEHALTKEDEAGRLHSAESLLLALKSLFRLGGRVTSMDGRTGMSLECWNERIAYGIVHHHGTDTWGCHS